MKRVLIASTIAALLAGCGSTSGDLIQAAGGDQSKELSSQTTATSSPGPFPNLEKVPVPSVDSSAANRNNTSSPIGRLCWARREAARSIIDLMFQSGRADAGQTVDLGQAVAKVATALGTAEGELAKNKTELSGGAAAFHAELTAAISRSGALLAALRTADRAKQKDQVDQLVGLFAFDTFDGVDEFVAQAKASGDCPEL